MEKSPGSLEASIAAALTPGRSVICKLLMITAHILCQMSGLRGFRLTGISNDPTGSACDQAGKCLDVLWEKRPKAKFGLQDGHGYQLHNVRDIIERNIRR